MSGVTISIFIAFLHSRSGQEARIELSASSISYFFPLGISRRNGEKLRSKVIISRKKVSRFKPFCGQKIKMTGKETQINCFCEVFRSELFFFFFTRSEFGDIGVIVNLLTKEMVKYFLWHISKENCLINVFLIFIIFNE